jgi:hypothetical protein
MSNSGLSSFSEEDLILSDAMMELLAPDGYYKYLRVEKPTKTESPSPPSSSESSTTSPLISPIDEELVKKNYRKLSRLHHPDRKGGNPETFRMLHRAQKVLLDPKLRQQYDILGIDLDDDEAAQHHEGEEEKERPGTAQGIVQEIASQVLAFMMQMIVRTLMTGGVSVILVRYWISLYAALAFLLFVTFRILQQSRWLDAISPAVIASGLLLMHTGRTQEGLWTWRFWLGETFVISAFTFNSVATSLPSLGLLLVAVIFVFASLMALWFRGSVWNYAIVIGFEAILAFLIAMAFPILEFVLETILNEKLKRVGDKVRAHHKALDAYYQAKMSK